MLSLWEPCIAKAALLRGTLPALAAHLIATGSVLVLTQVRDEIIENVEATYKETDLFKMFQTGDVSNQPGAPCAHRAAHASAAGRQGMRLLPARSSPLRAVHNCKLVPDRYASPMPIPRAAAASKPGQAGGRAG